MMNLLDRIEQEQKERDSRHKAIHEESLAAGKLHGLLGHCEGSEAIHHGSEAALSDLVARVRPLVEAAEKLDDTDHLVSCDLPESQGPCDCLVPTMRAAVSVFMSEGQTP